MYRILIQLLFILSIASFTLSGCGESAKGDAPDTKPKDGGTKTKPVEESAVLVEPGVGISGVKIDDTPSTMEEVLGAPSKQEPSINEATGVSGTEFTYDEPPLRILVANDVVQQVETTSPEAATADGVGFGASQAEIKEAFPEAICDEGEIVVCRIGKEQAGEILTDFLLKDDGAYRIVVARLLD